MLKNESLFELLFMLDLSKKQMFRRNGNRPQDILSEAKKSGH